MPGTPVQTAPAPYISRRDVSAEKVGAGLAQPADTQTRYVIAWAGQDQPLQSPGPVGAI